MDKHGDKDISALTARHTFGTWRPQKGWKPLHITKAEGVYFWDKAGKRYLDLSSQLMCSNLGHQNPAIVEAICKQARELAFISPAFTCDVRAAAAEKLIEVMPKGLDKFFFATSGTEANEAAIKIARAFTGKHKILARYSAYHGSTSGTIGATSDWRRWFHEPAGVVPGIIHGPAANPYKCPLGHAAKACTAACADYMLYMLDEEQNVAAVLIEPIVGTNGVLVPPDGYLERLAAGCKARGVLLICDEVMTGWGRTGAWFAVDHYGITPDILVTAKGVTNAMAPLGVAAVSRTVADHFEENFFAHGHTYEAHPLTLAPAIAAIDEYRRLDLIERAKVQGEKLGAKLRALIPRHPSIGDVRGKGLFWAVDLVKDRDKKTPFNTGMDKVQKKPLVIDEVTGDMMKRGVFCMGWLSHLVLAPPLIIDDEQLDEAVAAVDAALALADKHL